MSESASDAVRDVAAAVAKLVACVEPGRAALPEGLGLIELMRELEAARNLLSVADHGLVVACETQDLAERWGHGSTARMLTHSLRLSPGEAARRVRAAHTCGPRTSFTGEPLQPLRPALAAAQLAGAASPEQVDLVVRALAPYDRAGFDPAGVDAGEVLLAGYAAAFGPRELKGLVDRVVAAIDPDGSRPDDELNADRRHFSLRATKDGAYVGEFRLTGSTGAKLKAVLDPLSRPRHTVVGSADTGWPGGTEQTGKNIDAQATACPPDPRSLPQRRHDALEEVCDQLLRSGALPDSGGTPATVIVTIGMDDLLSRTGAGTTSQGTTLSAAAVLHLASQAEIIPAVLDQTGAVLSLGRTRRIASPSQTWALNARDQGCSFPGCAHPPELCERHHVVAWVDGGRTDLDNLTLLCRYHHHHFEQRGWQCRISAGGLPEWVPPRWIDPDQRPLVNARITAGQLGRLSQPSFALTG